MWQKLVIVLLGLTIVGAVVVGISDAVRPSTEFDTVSAAAHAVVTPAVAGVASVVADTPADNSAHVAAEAQAVEIVAEPPAEAQDAALADAAAPLQTALTTVGDPWAGSGTVTALDEVGITLALAEGVEVYIELAPPAYQQEQGVALAVGDAVTVEGFFNGEQIHARTLTTNTGTQVAFRSEAGMPLWSGGASSGQAGQTGGAGTAEIKALPEDWVTYSGVITVMQNGNLTMQMTDGQMLAVQLGQPRFWQDQGVTLAVGDEVTVLGYWQDTQFRAGEIARVATGERIMLLDPNGRPLWGGPGRNGNGGGQGAAAAQG